MYLSNENNQPYFPIALLLGCIRKKKYRLILCCRWLFQYFYVYSVCTYNHVVPTFLAFAK